MTFSVMQMPNSSKRRLCIKHIIFLSNIKNYQDKISTCFNLLTLILSYFCKSFQLQYTQISIFLLKLSIQIQTCNFLHSQFFIAINKHLFRTKQYKISIYIFNQGQILAFYMHEQIVKLKIIKKERFQFIIRIKNNNNFYKMDQYGTPYYPQNSRNYTRQQTPLTNQYVYDDISDNLRVSCPLSQDYFQHNIVQNSANLRKQLNEEMKRHNVLMQEVTNLQYQNEQLSRNQYNQSTSSSSLRSQNQRLREEIERKRQQGTVPQHLMQDLAELRRQNSWLRQNAANLSQKNYQRY